MAKPKKRTATRNKSPSKRSKASVKRTRKMAAKRVLSKRTRSKLRRVIETAMEPVVQSREPPAAAEPAAAVVVEATTVITVEGPAPDTVVVEHESIQSAPSGGLEQGALGQASR